MKFKKEALQELAWGGNYDSLVHVAAIYKSSNRWSSLHKLIFKDVDTDTYYMSGFSQGLTESQDESPYQDAADMIECDEAVLNEVTTFVWEKK